MKLRVTATVPVRKWRETLEQSGQKIIGRDGDAVILQWGSDKPGVWIPADGSSSYGIVINGVEYQYSKARSDAMNLAPAQKKKNWIDEAEEKVTENPELVLTEAKVASKPKLSVKTKPAAKKLAAKKPAAKKPAAKKPAAKKPAAKKPTKANLRIRPSVATKSFFIANSLDAHSAAEWCVKMQKVGKRVYFQKTSKLVKLFAASRREVVENYTGSAVESMTQKQFKAMFGV